MTDSAALAHLFSPPPPTPPLQPPLYAAGWSARNWLFPGDEPSPLVPNGAPGGATLLLDIGRGTRPEDRWNATLTKNVTYNDKTKALVFSGSGDFVTFGPAVIGGGAFTLLIVARPDVIEPLVRLWAFYTAAGFAADEVALSVGTGGALSFLNNNAQPPVALPARDPAWAVGVWSQIVLAVQADGSATVFINGGQIATGTCAHLILSLRAQPKPTCPAVMQEATLLTVNLLSPFSPPQSAPCRQSPGRASLAAAPPPEEPAGTRGLRERSQTSRCEKMRNRHICMSLVCLKKQNPH